MLTFEAVGTIVLKRKDLFCNLISIFFSGGKNGPRFAKAHPLTWFERSSLFSFFFWIFVARVIDKSKDQLNSFLAVLVFKILLSI